MQTYRVQRWKALLLFLLVSIAGFSQAQDRFTYGGSAEALYEHRDGYIHFVANGSIWGGNPAAPGNFYIEGFVDGNPAYSTVTGIPTLFPGFVFNIDAPVAVTPGWHFIEWRGYAIWAWPGPNWNMSGWVYVP